MRFSGPIFFGRSDFSGSIRIVKFPKETAHQKIVPKNQTKKSDRPKSEKIGPPRRSDFSPRRSDFSPGADFHWKPTCGRKLILWPVCQRGAFCRMPIAGLRPISAWQPVACQWARHAASMATSLGRRRRKQVLLLDAVFAAGFLGGGIEITYLLT